MAQYVRAGFAVVQPREAVKPAPVAGMAARHREARGEVSRLLAGQDLRTLLAFWAAAFIQMRPLQFTRQL